MRFPSGPQIARLRLASLVRKFTASPEAMLLRMVFHEPRDFREVLRGCVFGQGLEENLTILHALDAVIENGENTAVRLRPNQPTESLFERQHGLWHLVFGERVAAVFLKRTHAR